MDVNDSQVDVTNFTPSCDVFHFVCNTVVIGTLCVLGLVGNTLSFLVHQRDRHQRVAALLLKALAVADNCVLLVAFFVFSLISGLNSNVTRKVHWFDGYLPFIIKYVQPLGYMAQTATIWVTVLLAFNRFVAVCRPFHAAHSSTLNGVRLQLAVVVILAIAFNVPRVFQYDVERIMFIVNSSVLADPTNSTANVTITSSQSDNLTSVSPRSEASSGNVVKSFSYVYVPTAIGEHTLFGVVYTNALYSILVLLLPLVILVVLNVRIILEVRNRTVLPSSGGRGSDNRTLENNITLVMLIIIFEFLISHTPDRVWQVFKMIVGYRLFKCSPAYYAHNLCNLLIVLNSSTNFIVYYFFALRFRKILLAKICRRNDCQPAKGEELLMTRLQAARTSASVRGAPRACHKSDTSS